MKTFLLSLMCFLCFGMGLGLGLFYPATHCTETPISPTPTPTAIAFSTSSVNRSELRGMITCNGTVKYNDIDYYYTDKTTADTLLETIVQDLPEYKHATWDCDEIALYVKTEMARRYNINGVGFACGYVDGNRHAWDLIITPDGIQAFDAGFNQWGNESYQADFIMF